MAKSKPASPASGAWSACLRFAACGFLLAGLSAAQPVAGPSSDTSSGERREAGEGYHRHLAADSRGLFDGHPDIPGIGTHGANATINANIINGNGLARQMGFVTFLQILKGMFIWTGGRTHTRVQSLTHTHVHIGLTR